jgi:hypothetical protein
VAAEAVELALLLSVQGVDEAALAEPLEWVEVALAEAAEAALACEAVEVAEAPEALPE